MCIVSSVAIGRVISQQSHGTNPGPHGSPPTCSAFQSDATRLRSPHPLLDLLEGAAALGMNVLISAVVEKSALQAPIRKLPHLEGHRRVVVPPTGVGKILFTQQGADVQAFLFRLTTDAQRQLMIFVVEQLVAAQIFNQRW